MAARTTHTEPMYRPVINISNQIIFGVNQWTPKEFNLFCIFLSLINKWDKNNTEYTISVKDIISISNRLWDYTEFTKTTENRITIQERVMTKVLTIYQNQDNFTSLTPFKMLKYQEGTITFTINEIARPLLIELAGNFTQANLDSVLDLKTYPSKILYLAIKSKLHNSKFYLEFDIEDYKKLINVSPKTEARRLREKYIKKPLEDVNKNLTEEIDYTLSKRGTKYTKVAFSKKNSITAAHAANVEKFTKMQQSLKIDMSLVDWREWIEPLQFRSFSNATLTVIVPNNLFIAQIEQYYLFFFTKAITAFYGDNVKLIYTTK